MADGILVVCGCFPPAFEKEYFENSIGLPQIAADKLQKNIILGIKEVTGQKTEVVTAPFIGYYPTGYKKALIKGVTVQDDTADYQIIGFLNIKGIETYIKSIKILKAISKWYKRSPENRNVIVYSHYAGFMRAIGKAKKRFPDLKVSCVITDMPELSQSRPKSFPGRIKTLPSRIMFHITYKNLPYVDYFVLLTKHMAAALSLREDQYCVVECMCNPKERIEVGANPYLDIRRQENICFAYSGTLDVQYGIKELVTAFGEIEDEHFRLWICGDGNGKEYVLKAADKDPRIRYFGVLPLQEVINLQLAADILVNPRSSEGIFTKYSFPSKTIEYMLAGKPVLAYKLPGIPQEYDAYLSYIPETETGLKDIMRQYGHMEKEKLALIGDSNKKFAAECKNYKKQVEKVLDLMRIQYDLHDL